MAGTRTVRVLGEFGDAANRYTNAKARRNYAGTSPITRASGKKLVVLTRYARNKRLADTLFQQAFTALTASPGARAYYDSLRARGIGHNDALRRCFCVAGKAAVRDDSVAGVGPSKGKHSMSQTTLLIKHYPAWLPDQIRTNPVRSAKG